MHGIDAVDGGRRIDWGLTAADYERWRPDYPASFYDRLRALGVGLPGQRILDLATGVGFLARQFARQGAQVSACDIAAQSVAHAQEKALAEGLHIDFAVCPAEETGHPDGSFDAITASQCWLYFDLARMVPEVQRLLATGGLLVTSHFSWLALQDRVAHASEQLVLKHNPDWSAAGWEGRIPAKPSWAEGVFELRGMFWYDEAIPFTRESWRGRIRASRGVGATMSAEEVARFDAEHAELLEGLVPEQFTVLHRIDAHLYG